jgi:hypothetical protein
MRGSLRQLIAVRRPQGCVVLGMSDWVIGAMAWKEMVDYKHPWDHKPKIKNNPRFVSSTKSVEYHLHGDTAYLHDVWSNVHYGYVGRAVGFTLAVLLDGAGVAQLKQDLDIPHGVLPMGTGSSLLPRRFDPPTDRYSITLGFNMYPQSISAQGLVAAIVKSKNQLTTISAGQLRGLMGIEPAAAR